MADHDQADCCIAGGGPAGIMTGYLLARAGLRVIVLEKHRDFIRDFRGDTIHPATLQLLHELGILEDFLKLPHQELSRLEARFGSKTYTIAEFSWLRTAKPLIAFMPQWDFLNFLSGKASRYPGFSLWMQSSLTGLIRSGDAVTGVEVTTPEGKKTISCRLVIGADGRHSETRTLAGFEPVDSGSPIDLLWFRMPCQATDPRQSLGFYRQGKILIMIDRGDYWQCGYVIPKGGFGAIQASGLDQFIKDLLVVAPFFGDRTGALGDWTALSLLSIRIDHLKTWALNGLLCIGDAAHAMSPVGGVGINLALQDAVSVANLLWQEFHRTEGILSKTVLDRVQNRREFPARMIQRLQEMIQKGISRPPKPGRDKPPFPFRLLQAFPLLRRIPGRIIGLGFRMEHIRCPEIQPGMNRSGDPLSLP